MPRASYAPRAHAPPLPYRLTTSLATSVSPPPSHHLAATALREHIAPRQVLNALLARREPAISRQLQQARITLDLFSTGMIAC